MKTVFLGDLYPTDLSADLFQSGDTASLFTDVLPLMQESQATVVNLECALTASERAIAKIGPNLKAPLESAATLKAAGVTVCTLSNNHVFDFGKEGVRDTIGALEAQGLQYTGYGKNQEEAARPLVLTNNGETLCLIAVCEHEYSYALEDREGCWGFDAFETPLAIREAKARYDRVAVLYHGGKELCAYPSPRLRSACRAMAKSGADLILCQHSHCIGCYEEFEGCHILYGQGNFHFVEEKTDDRIPAMWHSHLLVQYDSTNHKIGFVPTVTQGSGIALAQGEEKEKILSAFQERNQSLNDGTWQEGWAAFCEENRELYTKIATRPGAFGEPKHFEHFAHYLDCEAHRDVWMQLFQTHNHRNEK